MQDVNSIEGRVSDLSKGNTTREAIRTLGQSAAEASGRIASGKLGGGYEAPETAEKTRQLLNIEQKTMESDSIKPKVTLLTGRISLAYGINKRLEEIATEVRTRVTQAGDPTIRDAGFSTFCQKKLDEIETLLNKKDFEGRSLMGGNATRSNAVDFTLAAMPAAAAAPDATYDAYFIGEKGIHTATFKDGEAFEYGASAVDPGVRDLVFYLKSGTAVTPDGIPGSSNTIRLQGMQDGIGKAIEGLTDSKKILGEQLGQLEGLSGRNDEELAYLQQTMSELTDADLLAEFIRSTQEMLKLNMNQTLLAKENETLKNLLSNI
tara:strand:- start:1842 stop:2801 length:960 start_codon:yes stop_codon:yes gene_type:complete